MTLPSNADICAAMKRLGLHSWGPNEGEVAAGMVLRVLREALAATQEQPVPGIGPFALSRAIEMLRLGRNGRSICFCNDEIDALLAAGLAALRRAPSSVSSSEQLHVNPLEHEQSK